jgi:hypothetical protein
LKEYQRLRERAIPTYYFKEKEAEKLGRLVKEGLKDHYLGEAKENQQTEDTPLLTESREP